MAIVIAIWGIIAYQVISALSPKEQEIPGEQSSIEFIPQKAHAIDTFSIEKIKRDPFLGKIYTAHPKKKKIKRPPQKPIAWPSISYQGLVEKQGEGKERIYAVSINSSQYLLKKGHSVEKVTLLSGNEQEVLVSYKNQRKTIPIQ